MIAALRRMGNVIGALLCAGLLGFAVYAQFDLHLQPCPLCIFQRIGIALIGLVFLLAAVHHPRRWGTRVYAVLVVIAALNCAPRG